MQFTYQTERLLLKILSREQSEEICQFYMVNREFLEPFEPKRPDNFYTADFHATNLAWEYRAFLSLSHLRYWLYLRENSQSASPQPIGSLCVNNIQRGAFQKCVLGYKLGEAFCHQGYMQEALSFLLPVILEELKLHRIEAYVQPGNAPSIRLLSKLGFQEEGYLSSYAEINGQWRDHLLFSYINSISQ